MSIIRYLHFSVIAFSALLLPSVIQADTSGWSLYELPQPESEDIPWIENELSNAAKNKNTTGGCGGAQKNPWEKSIQKVCGKGRLDRLQKEKEDALKLLNEELQASFLKKHGFRDMTKFPYALIYPKQVGADSLPHSKLKNELITELSRKKQYRLFKQAQKNPSELLRLIRSSSASDGSQQPEFNADQAILNAGKSDPFCNSLIDEMSHSLLERAMTFANSEMQAKGFREQCKETILSGKQPQSREFKNWFHSLQEKTSQSLVQNPVIFEKLMNDTYPETKKSHNALQNDQKAMQEVFPKICSVDWETNPPECTVALYQFEEFRKKEFEKQATHLAQKKFDEMRAKTVENLDQSKLSPELKRYLRNSLLDSALTIKVLKDPTGIEKDNALADPASNEIRMDMKFLALLRSQSSHAGAAILQHELGHFVGFALGGHQTLCQNAQKIYDVELVKIRSWYTEAKKANRPMIVTQESEERELLKAVTSTCDQAKKYAPPYSDKDIKLLTEVRKCLDKMYIRGEWKLAKKMGKNPVFISPESMKEKRIEAFGDLIERQFFRSFNSKSGLDFEKIRDSLTLYCSNLNHDFKHSHSHGGHTEEVDGHFDSNYRIPAQLHDLVPIEETQSEIALPSACEKILF